MLVLLAGCKLVDQRTFHSAATAPKAAPVTTEQRRPLLVIALADRDANWHSALAAAVLAATAHNPAVAFDVATPLPISASQAEQDKFATTGAADAAMVARQMQVDGVSLDHIAIRYESDPGVPAREVRIYAR